ncbi:hypothetical protein PR003_g31206 [Phytophthora rubi]|uniref:Uncharacterized protein n=1 Tax=Phytophthora rubi TaxID=129364 RepID=A0A6A4B577_9STRA|nr:hypothetical protein PR003_g31206 [Phytophthora rubi]
MQPTPLATGDYLLVLPEDVKQAVGGAFYGVVMSMTRSSARVKSVTTTLPGTYTLAKSLAGRRRVPSRKRKVKGGRLCVSTYLGVKEWPVQQVAGEVYPVIAMIMGSQRWAIRSWAFEALETAHDRLLDAILEGEANKLLPSSGLTAVVPDLKDRTDLHMEWLAPDSGASHTTSLDYVLRPIILRRTKFPSHGRAGVGRGGQLHRAMGEKKTTLDTSAAAMATSPLPRHRQRSAAKTICKTRSSGGRPTRPPGPTRTTQPVIRLQTSNSR